MNRQAIAQEIADDIRAVNSYLDVVEDTETRLGLMRLIEVLRSWSTIVRLKDKSNR